MSLSVVEGAARSAEGGLRARVDRQVELGPPLGRSERRARPGRRDLRFRLPYFRRPRPGLRHGVRRRGRWRRPLGQRERRVRVATEQVVQPQSRQVALPRRVREIRLGLAELHLRPEQVPGHTFSRGPPRFDRGTVGLEPGDPLRPHGHDAVELEQLGEAHPHIEVEILLGLPVARLACAGQRPLHGDARPQRAAVVDRLLGQELQAAVVRRVRRRAAAVEIPVEREARPQRATGFPQRRGGDPRFECGERQLGVRRVRFAQRVLQGERGLSAEGCEPSGAEQYESYEVTPLHGGEQGSWRS